MKEQISINEVNATKQTIKTDEESKTTPSIIGKKYDKSSRKKNIIFAIIIFILIVIIISISLLLGIYINKYKNLKDKQHIQFQDQNHQNSSSSSSSSTPLEDPVVVSYEEAEELLDSKMIQENHRIY